MEKASMPVLPGINFDWRKEASKGISKEDYVLYSKMLKTSKNRDVTAFSIFCSMAGASEAEATNMYNKMLQITK